MDRILFFLAVLLFFGFSNPEKIEYAKIYENNLLIAEGWKNLEGKKEAYWKFYYPNGKLKSEGHYHNDIAEKYWKFYYFNGNLSKEGHVENNLEMDWWVFYNKNGEKINECEFLHGKKHGFSLFYRNNGVLYKAKKFENGREIGEWTDYPSFVRDNK